MKVIIDIPEYVIDDMKECGFIPEEDNEELCKVIDNGTPIPDNATNDDVLQIVFKERGYMAIHDRILQWLFAPYQKGGK